MQYKMQVSGLNAYFTICVQLQLMTKLETCKDQSQSHVHLSASSGIFLLTRSENLLMDLALVRSLKVTLHFHHGQCFQILH